MYSLTLMLFCSAFTIAFKTMGNIANMNSFATLGKYVRKENESPVAKYLIVIKNLILTDFTSLK